ncbi:MAG: nicotinate-nucleotide adenylyltransferase [Thermodesulfobacteriota bacterium]
MGKKKGRPEIEKKSGASEKRIGLFGGTFNPIHLGHLRGAEEIREISGLDQVIFIPAAIPPHKVAEQVIEAKHRLEMVRLATTTNPFFSTTDIELSRPDKSYSIDTIRYFRERSQNDLFFILGRDAFMEIGTWKEFQELFSLCNFIVMTRPGFEKTLSGPVQVPGLGRDPGRSGRDAASLFPEVLSPVFRYDPDIKGWIHPSGHTLHFQEITMLDISSTKIRELIERGESVKYLISGEVEAYIQEHGLYSPGSRPESKFVQDKAHRSP